MSRLFRTRGAGGSTELAALTPMVDVLTILLVAILRTWNTQPPIAPPESGFALPMTTGEVEPGPGVVVDIGVDGMYVNGYRTGASAYWSQSADVMIEEMYDVLQSVSGTRVVIRAHADAPWSLLGKVLYTAQQAGYQDVELVALSRASL